MPVFVREVGTGTVEDRIVATGTLARGRDRSRCRADTAGALMVSRAMTPASRLTEGDRVEAGQTIAEITGEEVRLAARTEATLQRYETALQDYESKKKLFDDGLLSDQEFRQVETTLADAKIELEQSRLTESRSKARHADLRASSCVSVVTSRASPWPTANSWPGLRGGPDRADRQPGRRGRSGRPGRRPRTRGV